jgi:hypothetical protein
MNKIKTKTLNLNNIILNKRKIIIFSFLTAVVIYLPTVITSQIVTGSIVNTTLILTTFLLGPSIAILLSLMPSSFAFLSGLLPTPLLPLVPFIITGNIILIKTYTYFGKKKFINSIVIASFLKFIFLFASGFLLSSFFFTDLKVITLISSMFGWTQLITAVIGGLLALNILGLIKKLKN